MRRDPSAGESHRVNRPSAPSAETNAAFWRRWLVTAAAAVIGTGIFFVAAPPLARMLFSAIVFGAPGTIDAFDERAVRYITLAHGVLGAVMIGWGVTMVFAILGPLRRGVAGAWSSLVVSLAAWCIPDTTISLALGFWQNALINLGFVLLFAPPLVALRGRRENGSAPTRR